MKTKILSHPLRVTGLATALLAVVFGLLSHSVISTLGLTAISGIFIFSGLVDVSTGIIPNTYMLTAAAIALEIQLEVNGVIGGLVRFAVIALIWMLFALVLLRKKIGGGDLKMIGVTWLILAVFPILYSLTLFMLWPLALGVIIVFLRIRHVQHLRAGLAIASSAIITWTVGLMILK
jgi:Flp pilus assembly protein protease CpaA